MYVISELYLLLSSVGQNNVHHITMYVISVLVINFVKVHLCWKLLSEPENSHICRTADYIFEKAYAPRFGSVYVYSHCTLKHILRLLNIINVKNMMYVVPHIYAVAMD
jgi:hypothetical protein